MDLHHRRSERPDDRGQSVKRHEVKIRDNVFYIRRFDPFLGLEILGDLQNQFGAPMAAAFAESKEGWSQIMFGGLAKMSATLDGKTMRLMAERLIDPEYVSVSIAGGEAEKLTRAAMPRAFETTGEMVDVCFASVNYNFQDFIERLSSLISQAVSRLLESQSVGSAPDSSENSLFGVPFTPAKSA